jgi:hypothetical protein
MAVTDLPVFAYECPTLDADERIDQVFMDTLLDVARAMNLMFIWRVYPATSDC